MVSMSTVDLHGTVVYVGINLLAEDLAETDADMLHTTETEEFMGTDIILIFQEEETTGPIEAIPLATAVQEIKEMTIQEEVTVI